jgi:fatty-acid peroxygenase
VELLNVICPTTAIAHFLCFFVLALRDFPAYQHQPAEDPAMLDAFAHELRRFYPFTPFLGARCRKAFSWRGARLEEGQLVILDVYGTLHDPRLFSEPERFLPERFLGREPTPFDLIPQGGGDFAAGHRCAGEWLTIETLKQGMRILRERLSYELPAQDLGFSLATVPAVPRSGVVLTQVAWKPELESARTDFRRLRGADGNGSSVVLGQVHVVKGEVR